MNPFWCLAPRQVEPITHSKWSVCSSEKLVEWGGQSVNLRSEWRATISGTDIFSKREEIFRAKQSIFSFFPHENDRNNVKAGFYLFSRFFLRGPVSLWIRNGSTESRAILKMGPAIIFTRRGRKVSRRKRETGPSSDFGSLARTDVGIGDARWYVLRLESSARKKERKRGRTGKRKFRKEEREEGRWHCIILLL